MWVRWVSRSSRVPVRRSVRSTSVHSLTAMCSDVPGGTIEPVLGSTTRTFSESLMAQLLHQAIATPGGSLSGNKQGVREIGASAVPYWLSSSQAGRRPYGRDFGGQHHNRKPILRHRSNDHQEPLEIDRFDNVGATAQLVRLQDFLIIRRSA